MSPESDDGQPRAYLLTQGGTWSRAIGAQPRCSSGVLQGLLALQLGLEGASRARRGHAESARQVGPGLVHAHESREDQVVALAFAVIGGGEGSGVGGRPTEGGRYRNVSREVI